MNWMPIRILIFLTAVLILMMIWTRSGLTAQALIKRMDGNPHWLEHLAHGKIEQIARDLEKK